MWMCLIFVSMLSLMMALDTDIDPSAGLSGWTAWSCDVSCGTGTAFRLRSCINYEKPCIGIKKQTRPGCAKFPCPSRDSLPNKLWSVTSQILASMYNNFEVNISQTVELRCNNHAARKFDRYYPRSTVHWIKNERPLMIDPSRTVYDKGDLLIQSLVVSDTGVYQCKIEWETGKLQTIGIYAVSVKSLDYQRHTKVSKHFEAMCHNRPFMEIYGKLHVSWVHDGERYDTNETTQVNKDYTLRFKHVLKEHEGLWMCQVTDKRKHRTWVTNRFRLFVGPEPSIIEKIISNPVYLWGSVVAMLISAIIGITICSFCARRERDRSVAMDNNDIYTDPMKLFMGVPAKDTPSDEVRSELSEAMSSFTDSLQVGVRGILSAAQLSSVGSSVEHPQGVGDEVYNDEMYGDEMYNGSVNDRMYEVVPHVDDQLNATDVNDDVAYTSATENEPLLTDF